MNEQHNAHTETVIAQRAPAPTSRYRDQLRADITHYTPGDEADVLRFRRAMNGSPSIFTEAAYLHWLYTDPQRVAAAQTAFWLYRKAGQLHAHQGGVRTALKVGGHEHNALWLLDLTVSPKFRARGVHELLTHMACETADVALSLDVGDDARTTLRDNWLDIGRVPLYVRPLDLPAVLAQREWRGAWAGLAHAGNMAFKVIDRFAPTKKRTGGLRMNAVPHFDERADEVWAQAAPHYAVLCRRDQAFLNWRWTRFPITKRYQCFIVTHDDRAIGYAVLRMGEHHGLRVGYVVDFLCSPRYMDALLAQCLSVLQEQDAQIVYCVHTNPHASRAFMALGFMRRQSRWSLMLHACNLDAEQLALVRDRRNWFITLGDSDADRPRDGTLFAGDVDAHAHTG